MENLSVVTAGLVIKLSSGRRSSRREEKRTMKDQLIEKGSRVGRPQFIWHRCSIARIAMQGAEEEEKTQLFIFGQGKLVVSSRA